mmetsp:Transcript_1084/g.4120  ORF Transcript_1084/g.4120 Transcript_1084/m.4120 type:complete len:256 (+) Transcript_1084:147-914(+)
MCLPNVTLRRRRLSRPRRTRLRPTRRPTQTRSLRADEPRRHRVRFAPRDDARRRSRTDPYPRSSPGNSSRPLRRPAPLAPLRPWKSPPRRFRGTRRRRRRRRAISRPGAPGLVRPAPRRRRLRILCAATPPPSMPRPPRSLDDPPRPMPWMRLWFAFAGTASFVVGFRIWISRSENRPQARRRRSPTRTPRTRRCSPRPRALPCSALSRSSRFRKRRLAKRCRLFFSVKTFRAPPPATETQRTRSRPPRTPTRLA